MKSPTQELLNFVNGTHFEDLPGEVIRESKRVILDCIGVAIAALETDKGRYGRHLAKKLGGPPEAAILGTGERGSCAAAAFANSELINSLDYDPLIFPTHAPPSLVPASLALGESVGASGKDMILATGIGCELTIRLGKAIRGLKRVFTGEGSEVGKIVGMKHSVSALGVAVIAGAVGAGKIVRLDQEMMSNAVGLAAHFTPIPQAKWKTALRMPMTKYLSAGWASLAEVTAVWLAEDGCTADTTALDGELGFWRFFGSDKWDSDTLTENFSQEWKMLGAVEYKPYPCMRDFHVALDCFIKIINENKLGLEDIQRVKIQSHTNVSGEAFKNKNITDNVSAQFSLPYVIAAAANRVSLSEWQDPDRISDRKILNFMDKVFQEVHPDFVKVQLKEPLSNMTTVEVMTKAQTFKEEGKYPKGLPQPKFARMTDDDLVEKFKVNVSKVLPQDKAENAVAILMELEKAERIPDVVKQVTL